MRLFDSSMLVVTLRMCNFINRCLQLLFLCLFFLLSACSDSTSDKPKSKSKQHFVEAYVVKRQDLAVSNNRTGSLRARREVKIINQEEGTITKLPFFEGDKVKKGQIVAQLNDELLVAQLSRVQATLHKAELDARRIRGLVTRKLSSEEELARAETELEIAQADQRLLKTRISYSRISSPIDGVVTQRLQEPGNFAERFTHLLTIADPASLITEVSVSGMILANLHVGEQADVRIDALGDKTYVGRVTRLHPSLDPVTRQGIVEVELKPVPEGALPGQLCLVTFSTEISQRLSIPFRAIRRDKQSEFVFIINGNEKVERKNIRSGQRIGEQVEIIDGLNENDRVVSKGFLGLQEGAEVKVVSDDEPAN